MYPYYECVRICFTAALPTNQLLGVPTILRPRASINIDIELKLSILLIFILILCLLLLLLLLFFFFLLLLLLVVVVSSRKESSHMQVLPSAQCSLSACSQDLSYR